MNHHELMLRQQQLLVRSAQLRLSLADQVLVFKRPLAIADQVRSGLQWLYRNPQWPLGALMILIALRPRRALGWGGRLWRAWRLFQRTKNWVETLPRQRNSS
jgi:hypothetical protein